MKYIILISIFGVITGCASNDIINVVETEHIFVSEANFLELPLYTEAEEFNSVPMNGECITQSCNEFVLEGKAYYKALQLNEDNYTDYLIGLWTGGSCENDQWAMDADGNFNAQFPVDDGIYSWSGKYFFTENSYIEDGNDSNGSKAWNEAHLYYVPANGLLIYKATRSFDSYNKNFSVNYTYYSGPDFYYFQRCEKL